MLLVRIGFFYFATGISPAVAVKNRRRRIAIRNLDLLIDLWRQESVRLYLRKIPQLFIGSDCRDGTKGSAIEGIFLTGVDASRIGTFLNASVLHLSRLDLYCIG